MKHEMNKIFVYIKKYRIRVAIVCSTFFLIYIISFYNSETNEIERNKIVSSAIVTSANSGYGGHLIIDYKFYVKGVEYGGSDELLLYYSDKDTFMGEPFPIIYSSKDPSHNHLLVAPSDFSRFNIAFPDSLYWIKELLDK
jgi:hypothetical protein